MQVAWIKHVPWLDTRKDPGFDPSFGAISTAVTWTVCQSIYTEVNTGMVDNSLSMTMV